MEEKSGGTKDKEKKYVLYTVVNEDKQKVGVGVWSVRIFLGVMLLVALAVVPYVSLKLAQTNDKTLVVFQPMPRRNRSRSFLKMDSVHNSNHFGPGSLQAAALVRENSTVESLNSKMSSSNTTYIKVLESAITISLLDDNKNSTFNENNYTVNENQTDLEITQDIQSYLLNATTAKVNSELNEVTALANTTKYDVSTTEIPKYDDVTTKYSKKINTHNPKSDLDDSHTTQDVTTDTNIKDQLDAVTITSRPIPKFSSPTKGIIHNLAYVAVATSGNHIGGICVWKTNQNVTDWSYFYDNIPIEYQTHKDITDREMRTLLVATRLWSSKWHDYHVVFRSQNPSVKGSKHQTRIQLIKELDEKSKNHFTFELEWRLRKDDRLMSVAYALARLYKNFDYWFNEFEKHVDDVLGKQDWVKVKAPKRVMVPDDLFVTKYRPESSEIDKIVPKTFY